MRTLGALLASLAVAAQASALAVAGPATPQQVHIAYGADPTTSMILQYATTAAACTSALVGLPGQAPAFKFVGNSTLFDTPVEYFHVVEATGLQPGTRYQYQVGCGQNLSAAFTFETARTDADWATTFAIYGDMGTANERSLPFLIQDVEQNNFDIVLHIGDFAYDLDDNNGTNGDAFMNSIQPIAANKPYHTCPGNHESNLDFKQYRARFTMPGNETGDNTFHSFNVGKTHVVLFSSEAYFYFSEHGLLMMPEQYAWLEADLAAAQANRANVPWIITMAHRPMYCGPNDDNDDCHSQNSIVRDGIFGAYALEPLLAKYGVDIHFGAHEHSYSRTYPIYNYAFDNGTNPYTDPKKPIHILSGAAGCPENQDPWQPNPPAWSALELNIYGYGRLTVHNATHAYWDVVDASQNGTIVDAIWIIQHNHGPFPV